MHPFIVPFGSTGYFHRDNHRISLNWISSNAWILAENIFLSTNAIRERSRTHNARHSSAEKSEGIIAPMVPHKGRICTSLLRQDTPLCVTPFPPPWRRPARTNAVFTSRTPERSARTAVTPPRLAPSLPILTSVHPVNACPLADKQGRGLASPLKSRTLLSGGHGHGDINRSPLA